MSDNPTGIVKPLEWRDSYGVMRAETPFGDYMITEKVLRTPGTCRSEMVCDDPTVTAQADYARRILTDLNLDALLAAAVREGLEMAAVIAESPETPVFEDSWSDGQNGAAISAMMSVSRAIRGAEETAIAEAVARVKGADR